MEVGILEDMTAIIKEHVAITNHDLQHLEDNGREMETVTKNTMEMSQEWMHIFMI